MFRNQVGHEKCEGQGIGNLGWRQSGLRAPAQFTPPPLPAQYDQDVTTWSPQGRIFQIEYAMEAVKQGSAAVGLKASGQGWGWRWGGEGG